MKTLFIVLMLVSTSFAGEQCFYCNNNYYQEEKITVINRQLSFDKPKAAKPDPNEQKALEKALNDVYDAVPINDTRRPMRVFQFVKNWPAHQPIKARERQQVQFQTFTKVYYGTVSQQIVVP